MNAIAPVREAVTPAQFAEDCPPANAVERMLLTQVANSWERLQRAYEVENRYFNGRDMAEIVHTKFEEFKVLTRYVTDCERAWRHALLLLEKAQRRRQRETKAAAHSAQPAVTRIPLPLPARVPEAPVAAVAHARRE